MKTLFLTGGATGIGRATVKLFYDKGYNIAFIDNNSTMAKECIEEMDEQRVLFFEGSVTKREDIDNAVKATIAKFGKIDTLILNAGIHRANNILSIEDDELNLMIDLNIKGYIYTLKAAMPYMIEKGGGSIVVNASDQSFIAKENNFGYAMTKGAIGQLVKSVAIDFASKGITISGVCAGTVNTPLTMNALQRWADAELGGDLQKAIELEKSDYVVGRICEPEEVAEMFYFLSTARFVTGSLHLIDGGLTAR